MANAESKSIPNFGGKSSRQPDMGKSSAKHAGLMRGKPKYEKMTHSIKSQKSARADSDGY